MNRTQELLVSILSAAIRGRRPESTADEDTGWEALFDEAKAHDVHALLYPAVKDMYLDIELIADWERAALMAGMMQIQHMQRIGEVLDCLSREDIPVIVLKGLVLRELYPQPELRTMGDADLLVHRKDEERVVNLLLKMGYYIDSTDSKHIHFEHKEHPVIELHRSLINKEYFQSPAGFENLLWENAAASDICGVPVLILSPEHQILHLCLHMGNHIRSRGFGLRQLCDLVLTVESTRDVVDWSSLYERFKEFGIEHFASVLFIVCKQLLQLQISDPLCPPGLEDSPYIKLLIDDIFSGGTFGFRTKERIISGVHLHYTKKETSAVSPGRALSFLSILFPPPHKLGTKYTYAKEHPLLTPAAWVHRLVYNVFRKDFSKQSKLSLLFPAEEYRSVFEERAKLLRWMNLR